MNRRQVIGHAIGGTASGLAASMLSAGVARAASVRRPLVGPYCQAFLDWGVRERRNAIEEAADMGMTAFGFDAIRTEGPAKPWFGGEITIASDGYLRKLESTIEHCDRNNIRVYAWGLEFFIIRREGGLNGMTLHGRPIPPGDFYTWSGAAREGYASFWGDITARTAAWPVVWVDGVEPFTSAMPRENGGHSLFQRDAIANFEGGRLLSYTEAEGNAFHGGDQFGLQPDGHVPRHLGGTGGVIVTDGWGRSTQRFVPLKGEPRRRFAGLPQGGVGAVVSYFDELRAWATDRSAEALLVLHTSDWHEYDFHGGLAPKTYRILGVRPFRQIYWRLGGARP